MRISFGTLFLAWLIVLILRHLGLFLLIVAAALIATAINHGPAW